MALRDTPPAFHNSNVLRKAFAANTENPERILLLRALIMTMASLVNSLLVADSRLYSATAFRADSWSYATALTGTNVKGIAYHGAVIFFPSLFGQRLTQGEYAPEIGSLEDCLNTCGLVVASL